MKNYIAISIFDIFKLGPGPSSSHTIGPMKAAYDFLQKIREISAKKHLKSPALNVFLYGSLSSTGKGHGTHKAVMGGLLGWQAETCNCDLLNDFGVIDTSMEIDNIKQKAKMENLK